jgi:hypothetical protein
MVALAGPLLLGLNCRKPRRHVSGVASILVRRSRWIRVCRRSTCPRRPRHCPGRKGTRTSSEATAGPTAKTSSVGGLRARSPQTGTEVASNHIDDIAILLLLVNRPRQGAAGDRCRQVQSPQGTTATRISLIPPCVLRSWLERRLYIYAKLCPEAPRYRMCIPVFLKKG